MKGKEKIQALFIILSICITGFFIIFSSENLQVELPAHFENGEGLLETSGSSYNTYIDGSVNTSVFIPETTIDRLNRVVNISVNITGMDGDSNYDERQGCFLNVTFPDGSWDWINMNENNTVANQYTFYYEFSTNASMKTGTYNFTPHPVDDFGSDYWNFTIPAQDSSIINVTNVEPWVIFQQNATDIYRNETLAFNFTIFDAETPYMNLDWNVTLWKLDLDFNQVNPVISWTTGDDFNQTWTSAGISDDTLAFYKFVAEVNDTEMVGENATHESEIFAVLDHLPVVHDSYYVLGENNFTYRETDTIHFEVNASDYEDGKNISGVQILFRSGQYNINLTDDSWKLNQNFTTKNWTGDIVVPAVALTGPYQIVIRATDQNELYSDWIRDEYNETYVANNAPETLGATLNNASIANGPTFKLTDDLFFELNVTDVEDGKALDYAELLLINQETKEEISFFAPPRPDLEDRIFINISASLLYAGTWNVYVIAYDIDGTSNYDTTGGEDNENLIGVFEIEPDLNDITSIVIWVILAGIIGFVIGGFLLWRYARSKIKDIKSDFLIKSKGKKFGKGKGKSTSNYVEPEAEAEKKQSIEKDSSKKASSSKKSRKTKKRF